MELTALGAAALLARVGLALYVTGLVRAKNSASALVRIICDLCIATLSFWAIGVAILFQNHNPWFGIAPGFLVGLGGMGTNLLFFHYAMILTASGIVSGAVAERFKFSPLCVASFLLAGVIFPIVGHWAWFGWLLNMGFHDFAGATVLHVSAASCAAVAAILVGARDGKFNRDGSTTMIPGHSVPFAALGTLLTLVGFIPYVAGAGILRMAPGAEFGAGAGALNVLLCAAAAGLGGIFISHFRYRKIDVGFVLMGFLGGVVASAAAANAITTVGAVATGLVAGLLVPFAAVQMELTFRLDDPAGVIAIHGIGGAWGTLAFALFVRHFTFAERMKFLGAQAVGIAVIAGFSVALALAVFLCIKKTVGLRVREADEFDGLDLGEHDIGAYPDFQQTTIKSYHLREA